MKNTRSKPAPDEMRPEYDFRGGVRGKHDERYREGTNVVLLEPDLAKVFRDSETVKSPEELFPVLRSTHVDP